MCAPRHCCWCRAGAGPLSLGTSPQTAPPCERHCHPKSPKISVPDTASLSPSSLKPWLTEGDLQGTLLPPCRRAVPARSPASILPVTSSSTHGFAQAFWCQIQASSVINVGPLPSLCYLTSATKLIKLILHFATKHGYLNV